MKQKKYYYHGKIPMTPLRDGQRVVIQNEGNKHLDPATVVKNHYMPRSYIVEGDNGGIYRRNRFHVRPTHASFPTPNDNQFMPLNDRANIIDNDNNIKDNNTNVLDNWNSATGEEAKTNESPYGLRPRTDINKPMRFRDENFV